RIPWSRPLPPGFRPRRDEWVDIGVRHGTVAGHGVVIPSEVDAVFRLAMRLSTAVGPRPVLALRRFMGLAPTMKLYTDGQPRWRDGHDDDLEVSYPVVTHRPIDVDAPEASGLPATAVAMEAALDEALRAYAEVRSDVESGFTWRAFLSRKSHLAPG
ncbi:MAG: hypothetical protein QF464_17810, partial [Myxococcota bacterium]|nr:hypothetical protein [Myxococcota bacterium]